MLGVVVVVVLGVVVVVPMPEPVPAASLVPLEVPLGGWVALCPAVSAWSGDLRHPPSMALISAAARTIFEVFDISIMILPFFKWVALARPGG